MREDSKELAELSKTVSERWTTSCGSMLSITLESLKVELSDKEEDMVTSTF